MIELICSDGTKIKLDNEDYMFFHEWCWKCRKNNQYVARSNRKLGTIYLHRAIWEHHHGKIPEGKEVDHVDRDKSNCQKDNLRLVTKLQNNVNSKLRKDNIHGVKGVYFLRKINKWEARIGINRKTIHLGYYNELKDAALAYNKASKKYHGEYGYQNEI